MKNPRNCVDFSFHRVLIILVTSYTFVLIAYSEPRE